MKKTAFTEIFNKNYLIIRCKVFFSWLGINDIARDGQWVLSSSGQPLTYWNWVAGEPNNAHGVTEACGGMYRDGRWNDDECVRSRTFTSVCERRKSRDTSLLRTKSVFVAGNVIACQHMFIIITRRCLQFQLFIILQFIYKYEFYFTFFQSLPCLCPPFSAAVD